MKIPSRLKKLGLTDNEISVYLALLQQSKATGYDIAKQTGLTQPSVYFLLDKLREKNLALKTPRGKRHYYSAKHPQDLLDEKKKDLASVEEIMPDLLALTHTEQVPKLFTFTSPGGVQEWMQYVSKISKNFSGQEMLAFWRHSPDGISDELHERNKNFFNSFVEANITMRGILPDQQNIKEFMEPYEKKYGWHIKKIPLEQFASHTTVCILGNAVLINATRMDQSVLIENKDFADTQRQIFELVWNTH